MATIATSCAPCALGPSSSVILIWDPSRSTGNPLISLGTLPNPTSQTTSLGTGVTVIVSGAAPSASTAVASSTSRTFSTAGTILTYPQSYVQYFGLYGVAVSTGCANSITATPIQISDLPSGFIYPYEGGSTLPSRMISYLNGQSSVVSQLGNYALSRCTVATKIQLTISSTSSTLGPTTPSEARNLSTGTLVGIISAAVVVGLLIGAGLLYFVLKRRKRKPATPEPTLKPELDGTEVALAKENPYTLVEADSRPQVSELKAEHARYELPAHSEPQELP